jgi:hypothetical protein
MFLNLDGNNEKIDRGVVLGVDVAVEYIGT